ncbi:MAG: hypothetical protein Q8M11_05635 [Sulfuritalea sp.]|jgi:hypothetical protein|nr:hypothetical protein [Sulfuritalea sp.]MDP1982399.1 hypothetical protein [Sulfuritalea sp.]
MDLKKFSAFKYAHQGSAGISLRRLRAVQATLGIAVLLGFFSFPAGWFALLVPLLIYVTAPKMLYVGPRYLICGDRIVYFSNVDALALDESAGQLRLDSVGARPFVLEREKFPTNARKAHKIVANRARKFDKVSARLIEKVLKASPQAVLNGMQRPA